MPWRSRCRRVQKQLIIYSICITLLRDCRRHTKRNWMAIYMHERTLIWAYTLTTVVARCCIRAGIQPLLRKRTRVQATAQEVCPRLQFEPTCEYRQKAKKFFQQHVEYVNIVIRTTIDSNSITVVNSWYARGPLNNRRRSLFPLTFQLRYQKIKCNQHPRAVFWPTSNHLLRGNTIGSTQHTQIHVENIIHTIAHKHTMFICTHHYDGKRNYLTLIAWRRAIVMLANN